MTESEGTEPGQLYRGNDLTLQSVLTGFNSGPRIRGDSQFKHCLSVTRTCILRGVRMMRARVTMAIVNVHVKRQAVNCLETFR